MTPAQVHNDHVDLVMPRSYPLDPPEALHRLRAERPTTPARCPRGITAWLVTRYLDVRRVLGDEEHFSAVDAPFAHLYDDWPLGSTPEPGDMLRMDSAAHARLRRRLAGHFTVRRIRALRPRVQQIVDTRLDSLANAPQPVDFNDGFAAAIPTLVMTEMLGIPEPDRGSFDRYTRFCNDYTATPEQRAGAHGAMREYIRNRIETERADPGENILGQLVSTNASDDDPLSDEELVVLGETLLLAGAETTGNNIALGLVALLQHPEQRALLAARPELLDGAVEELLRYLSIIQYGVLRRAVHGTEVGGQVIGEGEYVVASIPSANHDPELQAGPQRLDVERGDRIRHVAFGHGTHQCLGQHLARLEMQVALGTVLRRIPTLRLAEPIERLAFKHEMSIYGVHSLPVHWDHIAP